MRQSLTTLSVTSAEFHKGRKVLHAVLRHLELLLPCGVGRGGGMRRCFIASGNTGKGSMPGDLARAMNCTVIRHGSRRQSSCWRNDFLSALGFGGRAPLSERELDRLDRIGLSEKSWCRAG